MPLDDAIDDDESNSDSDSSEQGSLDQFGGGVSSQRLDRATAMLGIDPGAMPAGLERAGLGPWIGRSGHHVDGPFYRTQREIQWEYPRRNSDDESDDGLIVVRSLVYTVGRPPEDLADRIANDALRIVELWNTGPYAGYLSGFNILGKLNDTYQAEVEQVGASEVTALGVPEHYLEIYDETGSLYMNGSGTYNPWRVTEEVVEPGGGAPGWDDGTTRAPQYEEWRVGRQGHPSRGDYYELRPQSPEGRERLKETTHKEVYLNGLPINSPSASRGSVRIKDRYRDDRDTWGGNFGRRGIVRNSGATWASIRDGGLVYKIRETEDTIYLSSSRPDRVPEEPEGVEPPAGPGGEGPIYRRDLVYRDDTVFTIDVDDVAGYYNPTPTERTISRGGWI